MSHDGRSRPQPGRTRRPRVPVDRDVPIDRITVGRNRRPLADVADLADSIRELGLLNPVTLTPDLRLVAGYHRLEACRSLGWRTVPARLVPLSDLDTELAEIDENLQRSELTVLERAQKLLRRKELYELKHPETRAYSPERQRGRRRPGDPISPGFATDTAAKLKVSPRTVQHEVWIARKLDPGVQKLLAPTATANNKTDLLRLARLRAADQRAVARALVKDPGAGVRDAQRTLKRAAQTQAIASYRPPVGRYSVIVADPPWPYTARTEDVTHLGTIPYPSMTIDEICALAVPADDDCILWLWTTNAFMREAFQVLDAWGFREKTILTWVKPRVGLGNWLRGQTEHCILAVRGMPVVRLVNQSTVLSAPTTGHSRKPDAFYAFVESLCPSTSRLDLFARERRAGWTCSGAELPHASNRAAHGGSHGRPA